MPKCYHRCPTCGCQWAHEVNECDAGPIEPCGDPCPKNPIQTVSVAIVENVLENQERIEAQRRTLALRTRSGRRLDRGKLPIEASPMFGGTPQKSLF